MPFPNKATQLKGGERRGQKQPPIGLRRAKKLARAKSMAEIFGREPAFFGSNEEWLRKVRDGEITPDWPQLTAAIGLQRWGSGDEPRRSKVDLSVLSDVERNVFAVMLRRVMGQDATLELAALPAPDKKSADAGNLSPSERQEREELYRQAEQVMSADELAELKRDYPL